MKRIGFNLEKNAPWKPRRKDYSTWSGQKNRPTGIYTEAARTLLAKQECPDELVKASCKRGLSSSNQQKYLRILCSSISKGLNQAAKILDLRRGAVLQTSKKFLIQGEKISNLTGRLITRFPEETYKNVSG